MSIFQRLFTLVAPRERLAGPKAKRLYHPKAKAVNRSGSWGLEVFLPLYWPGLLMDYIESKPGRIAMASIRRGTDYAERGEFENAVDEFTKALQAVQEDSVAFFERGRAYWHEGRFQEAIGDLLRAAQSNPEDRQWLFHIYYLLGDSYRQIGNHELAVLNLGIAIRQRPNASAYMSRGWAYLGKNNPDRARADFEEAARLDPSLRMAVPLVPKP